MKKITFFTMICAVLFACGEQPSETKPVFSVKILQNGELTSLINNSTIVIDEYEPASESTDDTFRFDGVIYSNQPFNLEVATTRNNFAIENKTKDELCIVICESAQEYVYDDQTGELKETVYPVAKNFSAEIKNTEQTFYTHCTPIAAGDHTITYNFYEKGKPDANIKVTVIYRYNK
ncbi:MAG: hypothetical protein LBB53_04895 [Prevotellaceae bacterium]|jgi:hypothetical protein|nr:hypothetical protein [Prevotellaceae bacterium]